MRRFLSIILITALTVCLYHTAAAEEIPETGIIVEGIQEEEIAAPIETIEEETEAPADVSEEEIETTSEISRTGTWIARGSLCNGRADSIYLTIDTCLYAIGGRGEGGHIGSIEKYSDISDTWTYITDIPDDLKGYTAVAANGCIYIIGGYINGQYTNEINIYNIATDAWTHGTPMKDKRAQSSAVYLDNKIYVFGGRDKRGFVSSFGEMYDFATGLWSYVNISDDSPLIRVGAQLNYVNGMLCISGGMDRDFEYAGVSFVSTFDLNDVKGTIFEGCEDISVGITDTRVMVFASDGAECQMKEVTINDDSISVSDVTMTLPELSGKYVDYITYNGYLYAIGGYIDGSYSCDIYQYSEFYGDYKDLNGYITGEIAETGNVVTLRIEEGRKYLIHINATNAEKLSGYTYKIEYSPAAFSLMDACAATSNLDIWSNRTTGTYIRTGDISDGSISFITTEEVPSGMKVTGTINTIVLKAESTGIYSIKYTMIKN